MALRDYVTSRLACYANLGLWPASWGTSLLSPLVSVAASARTALSPSLAKERINNRFDRHFGFELHFIRGIAKMTTRVGLTIAVMMAMALCHVQQGRPEQMRSLVQPIPASG